MSHVEPGWYRDPSGRFAGRYHDGARWTEQVADARGWRGVDLAALRRRQVVGGPGVDNRGQLAPTGDHGQPALAGDGESAGDAGQPAGDRGQPGGAARPRPRESAPDPQTFADPTGFRLTVGHVATLVGGLLVMLSVVAFDFVRTHSGSSPLSEVAGAPPQVGISLPLDTYATFGRWLVLVVILIAVMAVLPLPARLDEVQMLPVVVAVVCANFLVWSGLASFGRFDLDVAGPGGTVGIATSLDASPAVGAILGVVGYVGMAGGQFLRRPIGGARVTSDSGRLALFFWR